MKSRLALPLLALTLLGCSKAPPPAVRDAIVFDQDAYNEFFEGLSYTPNGRIFLNEQKLKRLDALRSLHGTATYSATKAAVARSLVKRRSRGFSFGRNPVDAKIRQNNKRIIELLAVSRGEDPTYFVRTAYRESTFDHDASARTSTAKGLFQFTNGTWLCTLQSHGDRHVYPEITHIWRDRKGACQVTDPAIHRYLLDLRFNSVLNTQMAIAHTADNRQFIRDLGLQPTSGRLYALHFFGQGDGAKILTANPFQVAATITPRASWANPTIFYRRGQPRLVWEVLQDFEQK